MATRFYFRAATAPPVSPTLRGSWNYTSEVSYGSCFTTKSVDAIAVGTQIGPWTATAGQNAVDRVYVSPKLGAQTISGTVSCMMQSQELATTDNVDRRYLCIYVLGSDGTTTRGTLLAFNSYGNTLELLNNSTNTTGNKRSTTFANAQALSSVAVQAGDRIIVEIGYGNSTSATTPEAASNYGDTGTDLTLNTETTTAAGVPWIEFSGTLTFLTEVSATPATSTGAGVTPGLAADASATPATTSGAGVAASLTVLASPTPSATTSTTPTPGATAILSATAATSSGTAPTATPLVEIIAAPATSTASGVTPTLDLQSGVTVNATPATSTGAAPAPSLETVAQPSAATSTGAGVTPGLAADASATPATTSGAVLSPGVLVSLSLTPATSTAAAVAPALVVEVLATPAAGSSAARAPSVAVSVSPPPALTTSTAVPAQLAGFPVVLTPAPATSTSAAPAASPWISVSAIPSDAAADSTAAALVAVEVSATPCATSSLAVNATADVGWIDEPDYFEMTLHACESVRRELRPSAGLNEEHAATESAALAVRPCSSKSFWVR